MKILLFTFIITSVFAGCSSLPPPLLDARPTFLEHRREMTTQASRAPFLLLWISDRKRLDEMKNTYTHMYVAPVTLDYLQEADKQLPSSATADAAKYLRNAFIKAIRNDSNHRYKVADTVGPGTFVVELAIVKLASTTKSVDIAANLAGLFIPGGPAIAGASSFIGSIAGHEAGKGGIAFAGKLRDGKTGELLAESYDERQDHAALILNIADFTTWGNAKLIMREWASEYLELMDTPGTKKVSGPSSWPLVLW